MRSITVKTIHGKTVFLVRLASRLSVAAKMVPNGPFQSFLGDKNKNYELEKECRDCDHCSDSNSENNRSQHSRCIRRL